VIVYCRVHGRSIGIVKRQTGGFPSFETRHPRYRDHHYPYDDDRSNSFTNLRRTSRSEVDAWCRECGRRPVSVAALVAAFEEGRSKLPL
jgi:hypothetical protein